MYNPDDPIEEIIVSQEDDGRSESLKDKIPSKYIKIGILVLILFVIIIVIMFTVGESPDPVIENTEDSEQHPLVDLSKIMNVPTQAFDSASQLIANSPKELLQHLPPEDWTTIKEVHDGGRSLSYTFKNNSENTLVTASLEIYSDNMKGRKSLYSMLEDSKSNPKHIVSESWDIGSGGFVLNDSKSLKYSFYYEPNIVGSAKMFTDSGATLEELKTWAHRINYSIYRTLN